MRINRRDFIKAASAALLLGPSASWAQSADAGFCLGPCLRRCLEMTTLERTTTPGRERAVRFLRGEEAAVRNDFLRAPRDLARNPQSLMFFGHITDTHVVDEESPARVVAAEPYLEWIGVGSAFHPQEDLTLWVLDSMFRTLNEVSNRAALDFLLNTGDTVDNAHANELSWFLRTLEGGEVNPDSGAGEDPVSGPGNDGNDPFVAAGFAPNTPVYSAVGNHDILLQGNVPPQLRELYNSIVRGIVDELVIHDPAGNWSNAVVRPWGEPPDPADLRPGEIVPDPARQTLSGAEYIQRWLRHATRRPVLGFPRSLDGAEFGCYSLLPKPGVPLRLVVLDTASRLGTALGLLDARQHREFLIPELEEARQNRELVIVVSHHPGEGLTTLDQLETDLLCSFGRDERARTLIPRLVREIRSTSSYVTREDFVQTLRSCPNVIAHVAGHKHSHKITPMGDFERGYWEIQTSSLMAHPQQARLMEIVYEGDGIGAIHTCALDHDSAAESLAARSRLLAYLDHDPSEQDAGRTGFPEDRNAVLRFPVPPEIAQNL